MAAGVQERHEVSRAGESRYARNRAANAPATQNAPTILKTWLLTRGHASRSAGPPHEVHTLPLAKQAQHFIPALN